MHMLLISFISQEVMLEEAQILTKTVDSLERIGTKTNSQLMLLNNFCHKYQRGQRFLIEDLSLHRKLVHLSVKTCSQLLICGPDKKRNFMALICDVLSLVTTLIANCQEAKSGPYYFIFSKTFRFSHQNIHNYPSIANFSRNSKIFT